ncbi:MAG: hypothetical protein B6U95_04850 [Thermofilum sp. ex4484_82]|nr:MAG: hypothetical protein B6U95_04850 [Thermofilum sp. ex4484_82]OYT38267.1 MAG: hypothetical protein B6U96_04845 [Archaeoglobales archaeon ex4484_92]
MILENEKPREDNEKEIVIEITPKVLVKILIAAFILGLVMYNALQFFAPKQPELKVENINVKPLKNQTKVNPLKNQVYAKYEINSTICLKKDSKPIIEEWVIVDVRDPNGNIVWVDQLKTDDNGCIHLHFGLKPDALKGKYIIYASCKLAKTSKEFYVSNG